MTTARIAIGVTIATVLLVAPFFVGPADAAGDEQVIGRPEIALSIADDRLEASERRTLAVTVSNSGVLFRSGAATLVDRVTTARNVHLDVLEERIDVPITVETGEIVLGSVTDDMPQTARFTVETGTNLRPGTYTLPVSVRYDYTSIVTYEPGPGGPENVEYSESFRRRTVDLPVVVEPSPSFEIESERTRALHVDDSGTLSFTITNTGSQVARDVQIDLTTTSQALHFGSRDQPTAETSVFVSTLAPGDSQDIDVTVRARDDIAPGSYSLRTSVSYENPNGIAESAEPLRTGVRVRPEQRFELRELSTDGLRVDADDGRIGARIVNGGPETARDIVVRLRPNGPLESTAGGIALGDLEPNASAPVTVPVAVAGDADPGRRSVTFDVEYETAGDEIRTVRPPLRGSVNLRSERGVFDIVETTTSPTPEGDLRLRLSVRNNASTPVSAITVKLFANDPLSATDDEAFIDRLDPGETATIVFSVGTGGAGPKTYPASIDFQYDEADGDTSLSDTHRVPVRVPATDDSGPPLALLIGGLAVLVLLGLGAVRYWG